MRNTQGEEKDTFVRSFRKVADELLEGKLDFEEFAMLQFLSLQANPFNGEILTNFADLANKLRLSRDKVRYICEKLGAKKRIWFELKQGQRFFTRFYVHGFPLANKSYIDIGLLVSEVDDQISELKDDATSMSSSGNENERNTLSEVPNKEKENENNINIDNKKEEKKEKSFSQITNETLFELRKGFQSTEAFKNCLIKHGYPKDEIDSLRI